MKKIKICLLILCLGCPGLQPAFAQEILWSEINVNPRLPDTFTFTKNWNYPWYMIRHKNGKWEKTTGTEIKPSDKARLYFTANCSTDVMGEHIINYCTAASETDEIRLNFTDGKPAYSNDFLIHFKGNRFYFEPQIHYKMFMPGYTVEYSVKKQELVLNRSGYKLNDMIIGHIDVEFVETTTDPGKKIQHKTYFLRGYFRTPLKEPANEEF